MFLPTISTTCVVACWVGQALAVMLFGLLFALAAFSFASQLTRRETVTVNISMTVEAAEAEPEPVPTPAPSTDLPVPATPAPAPATPAPAPATPVVKFRATKPRRAGLDGVRVTFSFQHELRTFTPYRTRDYTHQCDRERANTVNHCIIYDLGKGTSHIMDHEGDIEMED